MKIVTRSGDTCLANVYPWSMCGQNMVRLGCMSFKKLQAYHWNWHKLTWKRGDTYLDDMAGWSPPWQMWRPHIKILGYMVIENLIESQKLVYILKKSVYNENEVKVI
jgi:hypothetical protein